MILPSTTAVISSQLTLLIASPPTAPKPLEIQDIMIFIYELRIVYMLTIPPTLCKEQPKQEGI